MFNLIKFDNSLYGIKTKKGLYLGTMIEAGNYAIDFCGADAHALCEVMAAFKHEGKNFADFGVNGGWTFIIDKDVSQYLPEPTRGIA